MTSKEICPGVRLCTHRTSQFKTSIVTVSFITLLNEKAGENALVTHLLTRTSSQYPSILEMNRALAGLYGAILMPKVSKVGDAQLLSLSLITVDDRFALNNDKVLEKGIALLCDCIFRPDLDGNSFRQANVEREKRLLCEKIDSENDDKRIYAYNRLVEEMCKNEAYGINKYGKKEFIAESDGKSLYQCWKKLVTKCPVQINITGSFDYEKCLDLFRKAFAGTGRSSADTIRTTFIPSCEKSVTVTEKQKVNQGKLVIGMRAGMTGEYDNYFATKVMCAIFGSGTFSKLFMNVREKMSLCYYCSARLINSKGLIIVQSGVETENCTKALEAIRNELEDMKKGEFTDEVIENAKLSIKDNLNSVMDSVVSIDSWLTSQAVSEEFLSPDALISGIENVTRKEIIAAANSVTEDTVYILESEKEED